MLVTRTEKRKVNRALVKTLQKSTFDKILGFDPFTQEYGARPGLYKLTPVRAQHILDFYNTNNRKFSPSQKNSINKSVEKNGYQNDGDTLRFTTDGDIPEYQHRLQVIVDMGITVYVPLVFGVSPEAFSSTASALPRTAFSEISKKDKAATSAEVSSLKQVIARKVYKVKPRKEELTVQNAIKKWNLWKKWVRKGEKLTESFFDTTSDWNAYRRTFAAWASLMCFIGEEKNATQFLQLLEKETMGGGSTTLTREFKAFWEQAETAYLTNVQRPRRIWHLLCAASDKINKNFDGEIQLKLTSAECSHEYFEKRGVYRKFQVEYIT